MTDQGRWPEVKEIVQGALDLSPEERAAYLDKLCGDDGELRREVDAFLAISSTDADFFDDYTVVPPSMETLTLKEGDELGSYLIVREIGKGGMGAVYLAEDREHGRPVALKTVPRHSQKALLREKRLLASLRHPNIAILFDSGQTESGLGYFIMEYVEGEPITSYCERLKLTLRQRLELFLAVCDAVAYAHRNLVVHRDLKPKNILVTTEGEVKLLDFGIAKLLPSEPMLVPSEARSFTVAFASPEQLEGERTTTATDIYSLGVLFCLLLTGRLPYPVKSAADLPWAIRNLAPEKPSVLVLKKDGSLNADCLPVTFSDSAPRNLARKLRGDLDAIVLRALQKDADLRYESVQSLADDIRSFLSNIPVSARLGSRWYYTQKFLQRHRWSILGTTVIFAALITLAASLYRESREAARQRDLARQQELQAEEVTRFLIELFDRSSPWSQAGPSQTPEQLVDNAALRLQHEISTQLKVRGRLLVVLAGIHIQLGSYAKAEPLLRTAISLHEKDANADISDLGQAFNALGALRQYQGKFLEAESLYHQALSIFRRHRPENLEPIVSCINNLSSLNIRRGDMAEAERLAREALVLCDADPEKVGNHRDTSLRLLSNALQNQDRFDEAESILMEVINMRKEQLGRQHPGTALALSDLALIAHDKGDHVREEQLQREALRIMQAKLPRDNPQMLSVMDNLAGALAHLNRFKEAEALNRKALEARRRVLGENHPLVGIGINNLANILVQDKSRLPEAIDLFRQALSISRQTYGPESREVSIGLSNLAGNLTLLERYAEAESTYREALEISRRSFGEDSVDTAYTLRSFGNLKLKQRQYVEARQMLEKSLRILRGKLADDHLDIAHVEVLLGASLTGLGDYAEAERLMVPAFKLMQEREARMRRKSEALRHMVQLYTSWDKPEQAQIYERLLANVN